MSVSHAVAAEAVIKGQEANEEGGDAGQGGMEVDNKTQTESHVCCWLIELSQRALDLKY